MLLVICKLVNHRKFLMGAQQNECQISQNDILPMKFSDGILPMFSQFLRNWTFIFSDSQSKFSLVLLQMTNYICSPSKMLKRMQYSLIILVQGFCPLKTKITQFPGGFCLNVLKIANRVTKQDIAPYI